MSQPGADRPMPLAEADHCCGRLQVREAAPSDACENCPLLIERRRERVLQLARAE